MKKYTILVAEDDPALLYSFRIRLGAKGHEVLCAQDGRQAVAMAGEWKPDLLILDIHLPGCDGFSVQERVRQLNGLSGIPIIFVTGDASQHLFGNPEGLGLQWLLRKPFSSLDLFEVVGSALEQSQPRQVPVVGL